MIRPDNHDAITVPCPRCGAPFDVVYSDLNDMWNAGWWECRHCRLRTDADATTATSDALHAAGEAAWAKENPTGVRPTEVWVRCDCSGSCGDDVRMVQVSTHWTPFHTRCRGCKHTFRNADYDCLAALAEAEAQRVEREGDPDA